MSTAIIDRRETSVSLSQMASSIVGEPSSDAGSADGLNINLRFLQVFVSVSASGGVSQASRLMYRAQSGVTRSIKGLERQLGCELFERLSTGMRLTSMGKCVLARARMVINHLERGATDCSATKQVSAANRVHETVPAYLLNARRLQALVLLEKTSHMPTAARKLGVSQPAISAAMAVMQAGAGCTLFKRAAYGLSPTKACQNLARHCARALNELKKIESDMSAHRGSLRGDVMVGALPLGRSSILPNAIAAMLGKHPAIRVVTDESCYDRLSAALRADDIDFVLGALRDVPDEDLQEERLFKEGMALVVGREHPLLLCQPLALEDLFNFQWVLPRNESPARNLVDAAFSRRGLHAPSPTVETADLAIIRGLLLQSDMVAAVSERQLKHELMRGDLVNLPIRLDDTERWIGLIWRKNSVPSPAARALMQEIKQVSYLEA